MKAVLVGILSGMMGVAILLYLMVMNATTTAVTKVEHPRFVQEEYKVGPLTMYCEGAPAYNAVYVVESFIQGEAAIQVIPGGCAF